MIDDDQCVVHEQRLDAIAETVDAVRATLGEAPNEATGDEGRGMARVLVEQGEDIRTLQALVRDQIGASEASVRKVKIVAGAVTAALTTIAGSVVAYLSAMQ